MTEAEIAFLTAAFPTIEAIVKAAFAAHNAGTLSFADAKAAIAGGLQGITGLSAIDAAEDAKLAARFETTTPTPDGK